MAFSPDISVAIILVNWNGLEFTKACIYSLFDLDYPDYRIIVVDNGSDHEEAKKLKFIFPTIEVIETGDNLGFAGGNNVGLRWALSQGFSHFLLLNNDTVVEPDFLGNLVQVAAKNPKAGIIQPLILFLDQPQKIWSAGGRWSSKFCRAITLGDRKSLSAYQVKNNLIDWATGCAMLVSRSAVIEAGFLNEQFFVYFEDVEWSLRIRKLGFEIYLEDKAKIYHEAGASSKKEYSEGFLSPRVFYFHVRNQLFLIRSMGEYKLMATGYHIGRFGFWIGYFLLRGRFTKLKAVVNGIYDGMVQPLNTKQWR